MSINIRPIISDDSKRISEAINNALPGQCVMIDPGTYFINSDTEIVGKTDIVITANGARFVRQGNCKKPFHLIGCGGVKLNGGDVIGDGIGFDPYSTSFNGYSAVFLTDPTDNEVSGLRIRGFAGGGIRWTGYSTGLKVRGNDVLGIGGSIINEGDNGNDVAIGGYLTIDEIDLLIDDNDISGHAFGIFTTQSTSGNIKDNRIKDIPGQHGMYISRPQDIDIDGNRIERCALDAIKVQVNDGVTICEDVSVTGNRIKRCGSGIELNTTLVDGLYGGGFDNAFISGNVVSRVQNYGIVIDAAIDTDVVDNSIKDTGSAYGMLLNMFDGSVKVNSINQTWWNALLLSAAGDVDIIGNTFKNFVRSNVSPRSYRENHGVYVSRHSQSSVTPVVTVKSNVFRGNFDGTSCVREVTGCELHYDNNDNFTDKQFLIN